MGRFLFNLSNPDLLAPNQMHLLKGMGIINGIFKEVA